MSEPVTPSVPGDVGEEFGEVDGQPAAKRLKRSNTSAMETPHNSSDDDDDHPTTKRLKRLERSDRRWWRSDSPWPSGSPGGNRHWQSLADDPEALARSWRKEHGFNPHDPREMATIRFTHNVELEVTPMIYACHLGDLAMCRNHFDCGAAEDTRTVAGNTSTPMLISSPART